jgi:hypothetical protein
MTREEKLQAITEACVKANNGIIMVECLGCKYRGKKHLIQSDPRPIRLADVLLAFLTDDALDKYTEMEGLTMFFDDLKCAIVTIWNLRKDSLSDQSDDCISFLFSLLR